MARLIFISVDTTANSMSVVDSDSVTGEVYLDYNGKAGQPLTMERTSDVSLSDPICQIRISTEEGKTGAFNFDEVADVQVDGISIGPNNLEDIFLGLAQYMFTPIGGSFVPVIVTDTDGPHSLTSGQTYTCLPCPPASATMIFNFGIGMQNVIFQRMSMQGTVTSYGLNNIATYKVFVNDVDKSVALPYTFMPGDRIWMECTRTDPTTAASIDFVTDGISNAIIFNSTTYYKPRTTHYVENMTTTQNYVDGIGVKGINNNTIATRTNCILTNPVKGAFELVIPPVNLANDISDFYYGLNNLSQPNSPTNRYARCQYTLRFRANQFQVYELNVSKAVLTATFCETSWAKISSTYTSPGVYTIRFYWSNDDAATWTLLYTSLTTHNGTVNFHSDFFTGRGAYIQTHVAELTQN